MADNTLTNPVSWNFNATDYLKPTELRSGYGGSTAKTLNPNLFNPTSTGSAFGTKAGMGAFGNYSSLGMSGIFDSIGSLCSLADNFTAQNAPMIAQAEAQQNQMFAQNLYAAQQTAQLRNYYKSMGIDPNAIMGQNQVQSSGNNQLSSLLGLLGIGGNTSSNNNNSNNQLSSLLGLLGIGNTNNSNVSDIPTYQAYDPNNADNQQSSDDAFWNYIDSKSAKTNVQNNYSNNNASGNNVLSLLVSLLGGGF